MVKISKGKLNVDVPEAINHLQAILKYFKLRRDIYKILFRGKGLEFESYRDFTPDDDASDIDWKASSRAQKLLVKQYREERDLRIMFMVDVGDNMVLGSTDKLKCEYATELIGALAHLIINSSDRVGYLLFSDSVSHFVETGLGEKHFHSFIYTLTDGSNYGGKTDLNNALDFAMQYFGNMIDSVIIVSDFLNVNGETEKKLNLLSNMFETILIQIRDPLDVSLPDVAGEISLEDPLTKEQILINPKIARASYERYALEYQKMIEGMFKKSQADYLSIITNKPFAEPLAVFLKQRLIYKL